MEDVLVFKGVSMITQFERGLDVVRIFKWYFQQALEKVVLISRMFFGNLGIV